MYEEEDDKKLSVVVTWMGSSLRGYASHLV